MFRVWEYLSLHTLLSRAHPVPEGPNLLKRQAKEVNAAVVDGKNARPVKTR